ncbi:PulJ/GspJ family protein [Bdellovibrio svalbardensis]|uniref:Prepilin-type N-terminal cleavage/methylation domain-containing protein n=1 Tax=Bdellovibrio svalbardensis TaxID=2972972 RepID=A0ABT6DS90_9BACT|nr:prepilin-type N-terminal cleavage/methylation domain-containing protein [Bdellovibrio svalbardensis]MDG0818028.1 prepilin-type N-terminal cleavage/methylation domain-containing protein [Bdellovibrio svalbardensis]
MNRGFTIIEVLMGMAIFGILSFGSLRLFGVVEKGHDHLMSEIGRNIENEQMIVHMTRPVYFGHLAKFTQNKYLKECIEADQVECDTNRDYPLTAMDLETEKPLRSISGSLSDAVNNTLSFRVHCPLNQTSCDQAEYFVVKVKTEVLSPGGTSYVLEKTAMVVPEINNVSTFIPDASISPGRNVNVLLFLDNSNSLLYAKDRVKTALSGLTTALSGLNARVGIYTLGLSTNTFLKSNRYIMPGGVRKDLSFAEFLTLADGTTFFDEQVRSFNFMPLWTSGSSYYGMVDFSSSDTSDLKSTKLTALNARVDKLFSSPAATTTDNAFCQILHIIKSNDQIIPVDAQTPTVVMLLTNEDDETHFVGNIAGAVAPGAVDIFNDCFSSVTSKNEVHVTPYTYWGDRQWNSFTVMADATVDGAPATLQRSVSIPFSVYDSFAKVGDDCMSKAPLFADKIKSVLISWNSTNLVYSGTYTVSKCAVTQSPFVLKQSSNPDVCLNEEASLLVAFPHYVPATCYRQSGSVGSSFLKWEGVVPMVSWTSQAYMAQDAALAIIESVAEKNSSKNVYFVPVIHPSDQSSTCPLTTGAAYGTKYEKLVNLSGVQGEVVSICSNDYSSKISSLTQAFLNNLGKDDITLPASVAGSLKSVEVVRGGATLNPVKDLDYRLFNNTLIFNSGYLQSTDVVKVFTQ